MKKYFLFTLLLAATSLFAKDLMVPVAIFDTVNFATGDYTVQLAAFYAEDSADAMAARMKTYGDAVVVNEGGMYKVRIINLDAAKARSVINALRTNEGMAPGLLKDGRWVNADSI